MAGSRNAADLIMARQVAQNYLAMAAEVEAVAAQRALRKMPLTVRVLRKWAQIAAALHEELYLEPEPRP